MASRSIFQGLLAIGYSEFWSNRPRHKLWEDIYLLHNAETIIAVAVERSSILKIHAIPTHIEEVTDD